MSARALIACLILTIGPQLRADGQVIMRRYDTGAQHRPETGFGIEQTAGGYLVMAGSQYVDDTVYYSSVVTILNVAVDGAPIDTTRAIITPLAATYPGHANVGFSTQQGGYGIGGSTYRSDGTQRPALFLIDAAGSIDSVHEYGVSGEVWIGRQGKATPDGGYVICGETSSSGTSLDAFLLKIDSTGAQEWVQTYGLPNRQEYSVSVDLDPGGGYYIGGQQEQSSGEYDQWILRVDAQGGMIWDERYGGPYNDLPNAHIETAADGNILMATSWALSNGVSHLLGLSKIDPLGNVIWSFTYDGSAGGSTLFAIKEVTPGGDLISAGVSYRPGYMHGALLRTNSAGDSLWMRYYHFYDSLWTEGKGTFRDVLPTPDGGFIAAGTAYGSNNPNDTAIYSQDTWVVKVDSLGCLVPGCDTVTGIESYVTNYKDALVVAPNPARGWVHLSWQLPTALRSKGGCRLSVIGSHGGLVCEMDLDLLRGSYELDVSSLAPGIYYLHVVQGGRWIMGVKLIVE